MNSTDTGPHNARDSGSADSTNTTTRARILKVAEHLFSEKGYDKTGIEEIARNVGITKSVIYYHFKNKEDILRSLVNEYFEQGMQFKQTFGSMWFDGIDLKLDEIFEDAGDLLEAGKRIMKIVLMESTKQSSSVPTLFELWDKNMQKVIEFFGENMKEEARTRLPEFKIAGFFFFMLPWVGHMVFGDRLATYYGTTSKEIDRIFALAFQEFLEKLVLPYMWNVDPSRMTHVTGTSQDDRQGVFIHDAAVTGDTAEDATD